uniref:Cryptochrome 2 transcript variant e n=1 Tax=Gryllus bimaculatus TaxID=6999 RepID=A0A1Y1B6W6_GRYBI|nr:cryptochrome 2 transcript variant e [Gryllus bimaculatus]
MTDVYQQLPLAAARGAGGPPGYGAPPAKHTVHWFRKGLRLHDNPSLREGLKGASTFRCIFILDPWFAGSSNVGINKWRFLLQCLEDLDQSLRKLNSRLFVVRGQPADALPKLFKHHRKERRETAADVPPVPNGGGVHGLAAGGRAAHHGARHRGHPHAAARRPRRPIRRAHARGARFRHGRSAAPCLDRRRIRSFGAPGEAP